MKGWGDNDAKVVKLYRLYLEELANELMHILQRHRRKLGLKIMDEVNVGLDITCNLSRLTSAIYVFVDKIVKRVRIINFYPNPLPGVKAYEYDFTDYFKHHFIFNIYMEKV